MAIRPFLSHIDMTYNQILNMVIQNLPSHPSTANIPQGYPYWNTTKKTVYVWTGSASTPNTDAGWLDLGALYQHPLFPGTGKPNTALTGAQVISQITLDNGHTTGVVTRNLTAADIGAANSAHTHNFTDIVNLPPGTILGNNTGSTGPAQAITVAELLVMLGIAKGTLAILQAGTNTSTMTWSAKDLNDWLMGNLNGYIKSVNLSLGTRTATDLAINNSAGTGVTLPSATTTLAGLLSATDKAKLDGIQAGANNYNHPKFNPIANPFATEITAGLQVLAQMTITDEGHTTGVKSRSLTAADIAAVMINDAINNGTIQTWSSSKINQVIQDAIGQVTTGALVYQPIDYIPSTTSGTVVAPTPVTAATIKQGMVWVVSSTGYFGTEEVEAGDMVIAKVNNAGTTASNYQLINKNIPAIVSATTIVEGIIRLATTAEAIAGTNGTAAITPLTLKAVLDARVGGYTANIGDGTSLSFVVTHGLGTQAVSIDLMRNSDGMRVETEVTSPGVNTVNVAFNNPPTSGAYIVIIKK